MFWILVVFHLFVENAVIYILISYVYTDPEKNMLVLIFTAQEKYGLITKEPVLYSVAKQVEEKTGILLWSRNGQEKSRGKGNAGNGAVEVATGLLNGENMYSIEKELKILREFIRPEFINDLKKWKCYSENEISATEKRLHVKLPLPIRDIYRHMADLLIISGYLRPLELLHWDGKYLGFFLSPGEDNIIGIKKEASSGDLYTWEEHDPEDTVWEYEDELITAYEEEDEDGKRKAAAAYQKHWKKLNIPLLHAPLNIHKLEHEPRFNHVLDAYGLFLVIYAVQEWEEMTREEHTGEPTCLFSDFFPAEFSKEYFQNIADRIRDDFKPLSDHPELIDLGDFPLQMAYVHKNQEALLILGLEPVCFMLLTKGAAGGDLLEKVQEQTGLAFHVGF